MGPLLDADYVTVDARRVDRPVALLSVDLETDYGSGLDEALSRTDRLLSFLARLGHRARPGPRGRSCACSAIS